jgi:hypothetical protein
MQPVMGTFVRLKQINFKSQRIMTSNIKTIIKIVVTLSSSRRLY